MTTTTDLYWRTSRDLGMSVGTLRALDSVLQRNGSHPHIAYWHGLLRHWFRVNRLKLGAD